MEEIVNNLKAITFLGNTLLNYLIALGGFILINLFLRIFERSIVKRLRFLSEKTHNRLDDLMIKILESISPLFYFLASLYGAIYFLAVPDIVHKVVLYAFLAVTGFHVIRAGEKVIDYSLAVFSERKKKDQEEINEQMIKIARTIGKVLLWFIVILLILQNLGYNVTALLGGLGIGGIAVAFAMQSVLSDILAYFSIHLDKPFQEGDYIVAGNESGTVKKIGLKSTRLSAPQGEEIVVSNKELIDSRVRNFKRMKKRRITFNFGVVYETTNAKLDKIPQWLTEIMNNMKDAELERVHFRAFGDFSLDYEVTYYVQTGDFNRYMDIQQEINLRLKSHLEKEKVEMAYPTQKVYVAK